MLSWISDLIKKGLYYSLLILLTLGAAASLYLLSVTGLAALIPIFWVCLVLAVLVIYEVQVIYANVKQALNTLFFKPNHIQNTISQQFLLKTFPVENKTRPQFFNEYMADLQNLNFLQQYEGAKKAKRTLKKRLKARERWFTEQIFNAKLRAGIKKTPYEQEIYDWLQTVNINLSAKEKTAGIEHYTLLEIQKELSKRNYLYVAATIFGVGTSLAMSFGTIYLLLDVFMGFTVLASLPLLSLGGLIIPLGIVAGFAYGLMIYNTLTQIIDNDFIKLWMRKIGKQLIKGDPSLLIAALVLISLSLVMTFLTAGTWWHVVASSPFLHLSSFLIYGLAGTLAIAAFFFNIENMLVTLELFKEKFSFSKVSHGIKNIFSRIQQSLTKLWARENLLQIINPARLWLNVTINPLRFLGFDGHLFSIAATVDQGPISKIWSAGLATLIEFLADVHYFVGHSHHHADINTEKDLLKTRAEHAHAHSHEDDIPSRLIKAVFSVFGLVTYIAVKWDQWASTLNKNHSTRRVLTYKDAQAKESGHSVKPTLPPEEPIENFTTSSPEWNKTLFRQQTADKVIQQFPLTLFSTKAKTEQTILLKARQQAATDKPLNLIISEASSKLPSKKPPSFFQEHLKQYDKATLSSLGATAA